MNDNMSEQEQFFAGVNSFNRFVWKSIKLGAMIIIGFFVLMFLFFILIGIGRQRPSHMMSNHDRREWYQERGIPEPIPCKGPCEDE